METIEVCGELNPSHKRPAHSWVKKGGETKNPTVSGPLSRSQPNVVVGFLITGSHRC